MTHEHVNEQRRSQAWIAHLAHYDALTDLPNRIMFGDFPEQQMLAIQSGASFAVLYIDIDEFKIINDLSGLSARRLELEITEAVLIAIIRPHSPSCISFETSACGSRSTILAQATRH